MSLHSLYQWIKRYGVPTEQRLVKEGQATRIRGLDAEFRRVTEKRDILKKATRVIGYRRVVAGFEDSKRIRSTDPEYRGSPEVYLDQVEGGKAKLLIF